MPCGDPALLDGLGGNKGILEEFAMRYKFYSDSVLIAECDNVKNISNDFSI